MKKYYYIIFSIIALNILLIIEWRLSLSSMILIFGMWSIYGVKIFKEIAYSKNIKWINTVYKIYKTIIIIFVSTFLIIESAILLNINQNKNVKSHENIEYLVVLGAAINGKEVSKTLKARLDKALEYYNKNKDIKIIVSGGQGKDEVISEAEAMYRYLIDKGVDSKQIIKEDKSTTTFENLIYSKRILKGKNKEKIIIVTNDYHLLRSRIIAHILGLENEGLSSQSSLSGKLYYTVREYPAMVIYVVKAAIFRLSNSV
ncbi:YdcF family protein [[Clostridium] dakarense]|uniref:YdcF family protein n=1 Tax=Faecalimicrobium dakarense TaxID=1301100 RepID=UPI0004BA287F|nr:YdcF family protein [[Clostridium] dakarense]